MNEIKIEKNIPIPEGRGRGRVSKYPFTKMEVGDSFAIKAENPNATERLRQRLYSAFRQFILRGELKWIFVTKILDNEVRVWRIK